MVCLSSYVSFKIFYPIFVILNYFFVKIDGKLQLKKKIGHFNIWHEGLNPLVHK